MSQNSSPKTNTETVNAKKLSKTVLPLILVVFSMLGLGLSSKVLYEKFCQVTGYAGTTRRADALSQKTLEREIKIRFDANTQNTLNWYFKPEQISMSVKLGQNGLAFYTAKNMGHTPLVGTATYNVTPIKAAPYFSKIQCFCFTEQRLEPGEEVRMPVLFFVDPLLAEDKRLDEIKTITLSYTFHSVDEPSDEVQTNKDRAKTMSEIESLNLSPPAPSQGVNKG